MKRADAQFVLEVLVMVERWEDALDENGLTSMTTSRRLRIEKAKRLIQDELAEMALTELTREAERLGLYEDDTNG